MNSIKPPHTNTTAPTLSRDRVISLLNTALAVDETRFARELAIRWLASYPGDLTVSVIYAEILRKEKRLSQSILVLQTLCQADPESLESQELLFQTRQEAGTPASVENLAAILALGGEVPTLETIPDWGHQLRAARQAMLAGSLADAENLLHPVLAANPNHPLIAVTHLQILQAQQSTSLQARQSLAAYYHKRWPECLQCALILADTQMQNEDPAQAVSLMHQVAARDVSAQVATRLWGMTYPYQRIWPSGMEIGLSIPIPFAVAAVLGWNQLPEGEKVSLEETRPIYNPPEPARSSQAQPDRPASTRSQPAPINPQVEVQPDATQRITAPKENQAETAGSDPRLEPEAKSRGESPDVVSSFQDELERLAARLHRKGVMRLDGRYPVYILLSSRKKLGEQYGGDQSEKVLQAMKSLAQSVQATPGWHARTIFADDPASTSPLGIKTVRTDDAVEYRRVLLDLDKALAHRGEMIGAVLIVGGPEIIPFYELPNPVDDPDPVIHTDNPYGTRAETFMVPEWPVGRLPGGNEQDAALIYQSLEYFSSLHQARARQVPIALGWLQRLSGRIRPLLSNGKINLGYTAAVWKKASIAVFKPIGEERALLVSPPTAAPKPQDPAKKNGKKPKVLLPGGSLGYFNLHGVVDGPDWYGQSDSNNTPAAIDYPVALRPQDIDDLQKFRKKDLPQVVYTEACYGLHIQERSINEAISLKFLAAGTQAVVGSTAMSYGSVVSPLIAADYLGFAFWSYLRRGIPAGEALRQARLSLAQEMDRRQGYLDGEDQKTLLSFVLYGDPLAQINSQGRVSKGIERYSHPMPVYKTICEKSNHTEPQAIPPDVEVSIRQAIKAYIPEMCDAEMEMLASKSRCSGTAGQCPSCQMKGNPSPHNPSRRMVMISKQVKKAEHVHTHLARLTLDTQGKIVKLSISR
jgi:hypothetical protein